MGRAFGAILAAVAVVVFGACGGAGAGGPTTQAPVAAGSAAPYYAPPAPQSTSMDTSGYGGYGNDYGYGTSAPKAASPTGPLQLVTTAKLGTVIAASNGMTLYTNKNDTPTASACNSACTSIWPPLLVTTSAPAAPSGLKGTLGTVTWSDGTIQVTLNG